MLLLFLAIPLGYRFSSCIRFMTRRNSKFSFGCSLESHFTRKFSQASSAEQVHRSPVKASHIKLAPLKQSGQLRSDPRKPPHTIDIGGSVVDQGQRQQQYELHAPIFYQASQVNKQATAALVPALSSTQTGRGAGMEGRFVMLCQPPCSPQSVVFWQYAQRGKSHKETSNAGRPAKQPAKVLPPLGSAWHIAPQLPPSVPSWLEQQQQQQDSIAGFYSHSGYSNAWQLLQGPQQHNWVAPVPIAYNRSPFRSNAPKYPEEAFNRPAAPQEADQLQRCEARQVPQCGRAVLYNERNMWPDVYIAKHFVAL